MRTRTIALIATVIAVLIVLAAGITASATGSGGKTTSMPKPSDFSANVDNPWYPLLPRSIYIYRGVKDGEPSREVMTVTHRTKVVDGARCVVIEDRLYLSGHLEERTSEWYSQDKQGNVWYFGENTAELDKKGRVTNTHGSWQAGVNGARPGIFMFAQPRVGRSAQQEFYKGEAEDHFQVVSLRASVSAPYISSKRAMLTKEWSPLEPGVLDHKFYVRGIGTVLEQSVKGPVERNALVSFRRSS